MSGAGLDSHRTDDRVPSGTWSFGRWIVVPHARQLLADGRPVKLGARAFDILMMLVERRGQVAGKQELLDRVWPGVVVEENNLHLHISTLRKLLGHEAIRTVPGRGYQLALQAVEREPAVPPNGARPLSRVNGSAASAPPPGGVPADLPPLFGRDAELGTLRILLTQHRIVTVVGPGGVGKTRLALEAARAWQARSGIPVCVVELTGLVHGTPIAEALARALGVQLPGHQGADAEVAELLRLRELLIVLDNCEHRIDEVAALVDRIARQAEKVRILATSQAALKTRTEQQFALSPLACPPADASTDDALHFGAVGLFCARVAAVQSTFALGPATVADVVSICRSLEGLPLAIELAAARVPLLGLQLLRARLTGRDDRRLGLLKGGSRSTLPRHQTLYAAIDWSYRLLEEPQRRVFRCLGIFAGGFTLPSALEVVADGHADDATRLDLLAALVDRSLLVVGSGDPPHYRLLDSTRAFAVEQLQSTGELVTAQRRRAVSMLHYFELTAQERASLIPRRRIAEALPELDNLRAALTWLADEPGEAELHVALAGASAWIWSRANLRLEGLRRCREALARVQPSTPPAQEARLLLACARHTHHRAEPADLATAQRAVELYRALDDRLELFQALSVQAIMLSLTDDRAAGEAALAEMEAVFDPRWPVWLWGPRNWATGLCLGQWGRMDECSAVVERGVRLARAVAEHAALALAMVAREQCDTWMGHVESAVEHCRKGIEMSRSDGSRGRLGILLGDLSANLVELGQLDEAEAAAREAVHLRALNGTLWLQLDQIASLALARGRVREAAMAVGRCDRGHAWSGGRRHFYLRRVHERLQAPLAQALTPDELAGLKSYGATLSDEEAAWLALGCTPSRSAWGGGTDAGLPHF